MKSVASTRKFDRHGDWHYFRDFTRMALARVWAGHRQWADAVRAGAIKIDGPRALVHEFPRWLLLSHFAEVLKPAHAG